MTETEKEQELTKKLQKQFSSECEDIMHDISKYEELCGEPYSDILTQYEDGTDDEDIIKSYKKFSSDILTRLDDLYLDIQVVLEQGLTQNTKPQENDVLNCMSDECAEAYVIFNDYLS